MLQAFQNADHCQQIFNILEAFVPHFYVCCTHCIIPKSLLNHPNSFHRGMFKLNAKFDADSLLYSLNHFQCDVHTAHMHTVRCLPPPLTNTVKLSVFNMCIPVHSPWPPGYVDVTQIILVLLKVAGLFPVRPHIHVCIYDYVYVNILIYMNMNTYISKNGVMYWRVGPFVVQASPLGESSRNPSVSVYQLVLFGEAALGFSEFFF